MAGVDVSAGCFKKLVLAVEQVKQGSLANLKLLTVGFTRLLCRKPMLVLVALLRRQTIHITVRNGQGLTNVTASLGLKVARLLAEVNRLAFAGLVGATAKQVVSQQQLNTTVAAVTRYAAGIAVTRLVSAQVQTRHVSSLARLNTDLVSQRVFYCRINGGAVLQAVAHQHLDRRRHGAELERLRQCRQIGRGLVAHNTQVAGTYVMQVGQLHHQVVLCQRQAAAGLLNVHPAANTRL